MGKNDHMSKWIVDSGFLNSHHIFPTTKSVLIVVAMEAEAAPFVEHLKLEQNDDFFPPQVPFLAFSGTHEGCSLTVVTNGKDELHGTGVDNCGTVPASLVTFLSLQKDSTFDLVVNAGTCGGFERMGARIGSVFLTTAVANHDRRIPIPPFIPYGIGKLDSIPAPKLAALHSFQTGICTTGNSLDKTKEDDEMMLSNDASVKDMEAAAVAWSCGLFGKPYLGLKVVTDIVDGDRPTHEEFMENLQRAADSLQAALPKVIEHVCGRVKSDL
jgi:5'-methylthioadenosine nucleosidase